MVTGGASGIGEAVVRQLVAEGAAVLAGDINKERMDALAKELGARCVGLRADVTKEDDCKAMVAAAVQKFGKLDVGFNIAGTTRAGALIDLAAEDWRYAIDICLHGTFHCMKHQALQMKSTGKGGAIVNVASLNAHVPAWGMASYCAAKAGLEMLGNCGSLEFAEWNIRVNSVLPGLTATPLTSGMTPEIINAYLERIPFKRQSTAAEQAEVCLFLNSDAASYMSGASVCVDGGWSHTAYPDTRAWLRPNT
jgi:NAD(P)-dependent dehydrogenase (short-subunit alcohol dehydrogenase family)